MGSDVYRSLQLSESILLLRSLILFIRSELVDVLYFRGVHKKGSMTLLSRSPGK